MLEKFKKSETKSAIGEINLLKNEIKSLKEFNKQLEKENSRKEKELSENVFDLKKKNLELEDFIKNNKAKNKPNKVNANSKNNFLYITNSNNYNSNVILNSNGLGSNNKGKINTSNESIKETENEGHNNQERFEKIVK